jgi:hypothetical protein
MDDPVILATRPLESPQIPMLNNDPFAKSCLTVKFIPRYLVRRNAAVALQTGDLAEIRAVASTFSIRTVPTKICAWEVSKQILAAAGMEQQQRAGLWGRRYCSCSSLLACPPRYRLYRVVIFSRGSSDDVESS